MTASEHAQTELALIEAVVRSARTKPVAGPAPTNPVARVMVDSPLPHLDRSFDYLVTEAQHDHASAGVRVRVRFAGKEVGGLVLERVAASEHAGRLTPLSRVVSDVPVLTGHSALLVRAVADRYAGTFMDVARAAVPPRHARVEAEFVGRAEQAGDKAPLGPAVTGVGWARYSGGEALLSRLAVPGVESPRPRAVWTALPSDDVPVRVAELVVATCAAGLASVVVVPDARDVIRFEEALLAMVGDTRVVRLTADLGPAARYRAFMRVLVGDASVVVGTRAAAFAPVRDLGLAVIWDDGDDLHAEPHAPYWHAREVLALRAAQSGAALVLAAHSRSVEAAQALQAGWAREVVAPRATVRLAAPRVTGTDESDLARDPAAQSARLPHRAFTTAREALESGPVLVQVPRRGYVPALACQRCRELARCADCTGPLQATSGHAVPSCRWCGRLAGDHVCAECGGRSLRAVTVGAGRTAEELGRAFPLVPVITSGRDGVVDTVSERSALVVCTPGAEPVARGGYAAALLLDARALLDRVDLRSNEEALRRWVNAASLVRPAAEGGRVVIVADAALPAVQALVRWDPAGFAERERQERVELRLPPPWRVVEVSGAPHDVQSFLDVLDLPPSGRVLGPVPVDVRGEVRSRALVSATHDEGAALASACKVTSSVRSASKTGGPVTVRFDPVAIG